MSAERQRQALAFFARMGWTPEQSAGIVANLIAESGLNPAAVGDGGKAYGIAQWHPDRQQNFRAIIGRDIRGSSFEDQLAFVHAELNGFEKAAGDALRACTSPYDAGSCVSVRYERPADRDGEALKRGKLAERLLATAQIDAGAPISHPDIHTPQPPEKKPMLPLLLPAVLQMIPQLIGIFGKGGERAAQNAQAAQAVADAITTATSSVNLQAGIEKMAASPEAKAAATAAVLQTPAVAALLEVGGGVVEARKADLATMAQSKPFWTSSAVFWISLLLLPMVYWYVGSMIVGGAVGTLTMLGIEMPSWMVFLLSLFGGEWNGESRSGGFNLVIGLVLGGICGVYYGVSVTQNNQRRASDSAPPAHT